MAYKRGPCDKAPIVYTKVHYMFPNNFTFAKCEAKRGKNSYCYTRRIDAVTCKRCLALYEQYTNAPYYALIKRAQEAGISIATIKQAIGI